jgi:hypothetical protein
MSYSSQKDTLPTTAFLSLIIMKIINPRLQKIFHYLSKINQIAYEDEFLIANNVLSKNLFLTSLINDHLLKKTPKKTSVFFKAKKLLLYYAKNFTWLIRFIGKNIVHYLSRQSCPLSFDDRKWILIDTYTSFKQITKKDNFEDVFLPGLLEILKDQRASYCLTPILYGSRNIVQLFRAFRFFKEKNIPVLTEFQVLSKVDFFRMLLFIIFYPISVIRLIRSLKTSYEDQLLASALWETLDDVVAESYLRLLFGKKICQMPAPAIQCISWCENQARHKTFYKGLHDTPGKVTIVGAQLFIWPESMLHLHLDEEEKKFGVIPDKILVNGDYYLPSSGSSRFSVGPSMRYKKIFQSVGDPLNSNNILVVMPYAEDEQDIAMALELADNLLPETSVLVKFHPSTDGKQYVDRFQGKVEITERNLCDLLRETKLIIGRSSGALVEAISLGVPTIVIDGNRFCLDYIPPHLDGKGLIWDKVTNISEAINLIPRFDQNLQKNSADIKSLTEKYRKMFFCEPTKDKIIEAFRLNSND